MFEHVGARLPREGRDAGLRIADAERPDGRRRHDDVADPRWRHHENPLIAGALRHGQSPARLLSMWSSSFL